MKKKLKKKQIYSLVSKIRNVDIGRKFFLSFFLSIYVSI